MPLIVNTNIQSFNAQRQLSGVQLRLAKSFEKLSSGNRVNRAGDDAAGLAISNEMEADIRGMRQAVRNAQDGVAMLNVADGSMQNMVSLLQRVRELAVQAANDTYDINKRRIIRTEIQQLFFEINRIADSTQFNGVSLLNASSPTEFLLQVGSGNNGNGTDVIDVASALDNLLATALFLGTAGVPHNQAANYMLSRVDRAMGQINAQLARLGALQNRLEGVIGNLEVTIENISAARSRIMDTDVALETAQLTKNQILQQSTLAILSQANVAPQAALRLLQ
ncbi:MAG: flagellin FliC [Cyanobacteria bacterium HKST-UBA04]|nr:flagellin FliC [Cyanobacteria bacterium HKST-UBA04]